MPHPRHHGLLWDTSVRALRDECVAEAVNRRVWESPLPGRCRETFGQWRDHIALENDADGVALQTSTALAMKNLSVALAGQTREDSPKFSVQRYVSVLAVLGAAALLSGDPRPSHVVSNLDDVLVEIHVTPT